MNSNKIGKTPKIRFKSFSNKWEETALNKILIPKKVKNKDKAFNKANVLSVTQEFGLVNQIEYLGRSYSGSDLSNYGVVDVGDVVYTKSPLKTAPYGVVKSNRFEKGVVSTLYAVYSVINKHSSCFVDRYFELTDHLNKYLRPLVHKGAKNDMKISAERALIDSIYIPDISEQKQIASLFDLFDLKLTTLREKKNLLEQQRKGVRQRLFRQEIRFKDKNEKNFPDWVNVNFDKVFKRITRKNKEDNHNVLTISAQRGLINQEKYFNKSVSAKNVTGYYLIEKGEFAYNKSYSKGYPMGAIKRLNKYDKGVVSTLYICFKTHGEQHEEFWEQYFEAGQLNREINKIAQEGARNHGLLNVSVTEFFQDIKVQMPHKKEQERIAAFLRTFDAKINAVNQQIELTQTFKKGLLQQMFV